jgi:hypothetical protein
MISPGLSGNLKLCRATGARMRLLTLIWCTNFILSTRRDIEAFRNEMRAEFSGLRVEMNARFGEFRAEIQEVRGNERRF